MNIFKFSTLAVLMAALVLGGAGCKKGPGKGVTQIPGRTGATTVIGEPKPSEPLVPARSNPLYDPKVGTGELTSTPVKDEFKPTPEGIPLGRGFDPSNYTEDRAFFAKDTVYFDFDRSAVRASERVKVEEVATVLKGQPNNVVMIEGHCDERGTEEYNRALGERRALAIREYLINLGIQAERVQTISYGEDKPAELGTGESVWAKNRRGEFILMKPRQ